MRLLLLVNISDAEGGNCLPVNLVAYPKEMALYEHCCENHKSHSLTFILWDGHLKLSTLCKA
jgi:hypothetical protein